MATKKVHAKIDETSPVFKEKNRSETIREALELYYRFKDITLLDTVYEKGLAEMDKQAKCFEMYLCENGGYN